VEETCADFRNAGADLPPEKKKRMAELQAELAEVTQKFSENVLDSTNAFSLVVDDEARLAGLPDTARDAALADAKAKDLGSEEEPKWRFTLQHPSMFPVFQYADAQGEMVHSTYLVPTDVLPTYPLAEVAVVPGPQPVAVGTEPTPAPSRRQGLFQRKHPAPLIVAGGLLAAGGASAGLALDAKARVEARARANDREGFDRAWEQEQAFGYTAYGLFGLSAASFGVFLAW